jgi:hypothetical protein
VPATRQAPLALLRLRQRRRQQVPPRPVAIVLPPRHPRSPGAAGGTSSPIIPVPSRWSGVTMWRTIRWVRAMHWHGPRGVMGGGLCNTEIQCRAVLGPECLRLGAAAPPWNDWRECMLVFWGVGGLPVISHGGRVVLARCVEATTVDCLPALTRIPWTLGRLAERPNAPPPQPPGRHTLPSAFAH